MRFIDRLRAVIGLVVDVLAHAIDLSDDKKEPGKALDGAQVWLLPKKAGAGAMRQDDKRTA